MVEAPLRRRRSRHRGELEPLCSVPALQKRLHRSIPRVEDDVARTAFDGPLEAILIVLLSFGPLAYGAGEPRGELVVLALCGLLAIGLGLRFAIHSSTAFTWTRAYVPLGLFVALAIVQLLPLPVGILRFVSPATVDMRRELMSAAQNGQAAERYASLSFYPWATAHGLRLLAAVSTVFVVTVSVYRRVDQVRRLLTAIAIIGALTALVAIYQNVATDPTLYGIFGRMPAGQVNSGPFVNHSHFGQFMNLTMGASCGLLLMTLDERNQARRASPGRRIARRQAGAWRLWLLGLSILAGAATICLSLTRGGMLSLLVSGGITGIRLAMRRGRKRGNGAGMMIGGIIALLSLVYFGFDTVYNHIADSRRTAHDTGIRWEIIKELSSAWMRFPLVGTGLGTHEVVFPMYDLATRIGDFTHAENEYAQLIEETGLVGLALCATFLLIVFHHYLRLTARTGDPLRTAAFGLGFGLIAVLIHSLSDFGQHMPANALLSAAFFGLIVGIGAGPRDAVATPRMKQR